MWGYARVPSQLCGRRQYKSLMSHIAWKKKRKRSISRLLTEIKVYTEHLTSPHSHISSLEDR